MKRGVRAARCRAAASDILCAAWVAESKEIKGFLWSGNPDPLSWPFEAGRWGDPADLTELAVKESLSP